MADEESSHERMQRYQSLEETEREYRTEKRAVMEEVKTDIAGVVESAVEKEGANVTVEATSNDGTVQTLTARLDRAALIARISDELPEGFSVKRVRDDGTLAIEWSRRKTSAEQRASAIIQAIVNEEIVTDADDLIVSAPTRSDVIQRAGELGVPEDLAGSRLQRLDDIGLVDIEDGQVFPDSD